MPPRRAADREYLMAFDIIHPLWQIMLLLFPRTYRPAV
jgi:hypothetical protein